MIGWLILAAYVVGLLPAAKAAVPLVVGQNKARCHGESRDRHTWSAFDYCHKWCAPGCWRVDAHARPLDFEHAIYASLASLGWPLLVLPWLLFRSQRPTRSIDESIARLEKELGMGGPS